MTKNMTGTQIKKAQRALSRKLEEQYSLEEIETFEWFCDEETADAYIWKFRIPDEGRIQKLAYIKLTSCVVIEEER